MWLEETYFCKRKQARKWETENISISKPVWIAFIENGADINMNTDIFNSYFNFCLDMLIPTKDIKI